MYDFVIIHGSYGHQFENWTPWLFKELLNDKKNVLAPQFPTINQNYETWKNILSAYDDFIDENTSFIAHSLGPSFVINYLLDKNKKINNLYFVAPFYGLINIKDFDDVNHTFFKYQSISISKDLFNKAYCFYSNNDPYVPINMSKCFSNELSATVRIIDNGGHLNEKAGFTSFQELLKVIKENG